MVRCSVTKTLERITAGRRVLNPTRRREESEADCGNKKVRVMAETRFSVPGKQPGYGLLHHRDEIAISFAIAWTPKSTEHENPQAL